MSSDGEGFQISRSVGTNSSNNNNVAPNSVTLPEFESGLYYKTFNRSVATDP